MDSTTSTAAVQTDRFPSLPHPGPPPELPEVPRGIKPGPRWRPWTAPVALFTTFGVVLVGATIVALFGSVFGADLKDPPTSVTVGSTYLQDIILVIGAIGFARIASVPTAADFGLRLRRPWRTGGWMLLVWFAFFVFTALWALALGLEDPERNLRNELGTEEGTFALLAAAALVTVAAPIGEEFFFRGYFYRSLSNWHGFWPAAVITGLIFGGIHLGSTDVPYLVPLAILGFLLCLLYHLTNSLYPCVVLHALNNSLAFGVGVGWDWQIPVTMVVSSLICVGILVLVGRGLDSWARRASKRKPRTAIPLQPLAP